MFYVVTIEPRLKWELSKMRVAPLGFENLILKVVKNKNTWFIHKTAAKQVDVQIKCGNHKKKTGGYKYGSTY